MNSSSIALSPVTILSRFLRDLPIPKKMALVIILYSVVIVSLLLLCYFGMDILSSDRAYVGGEGLWSKAQKQAVLQLGHYAWSRDEKEYQLYLAALQIPLGDHQARLELQKMNPDIDAAATGFLRGGNHPKDIRGMIRLFRWFHGVSYMREAIVFWTGGDEDIAKLQTVGRQIHRELTSGHASLSRLQKLLLEVQDINAHVTPLENAFSATLGEGARWLKGVLLWVMSLAAGAFLSVSLLGVFSISRHLCGEIEQLREGASRMAGGDYSFSLNVESNDEVGDLARSFQRMASQRQEADRLLQRHALDLEAANKELEAFSYSVSHDLRAPLRAIDGFSRELEQNCAQALDDRSRQDLQRIRAATLRMAQLIDDLLELSRLSRSELRREPIDLSAQVGDIVQKLKESDPDRRQVAMVVAPQVKVEGDKRLLQIVMENLLQNAWKFTGKERQARIEFGASDLNGKRTFFVKDNGVGFDMAYADKLFKPFQRLHDTKEFPGTGIGLALVSRIILRHGGHVWTEAKENHGAAFYFTLS